MRMDFIPGQSKWLFFNGNCIHFTSKCCEKTRKEYRSINFYRKSSAFNIKKNAKHFAHKQTCFSFVWAHKDQWQKPTKVFHFGLSIKYFFSSFFFLSLCQHFPTQFTVINFLWRQVIHRLDYLFEFNNEKKHLKLRVNSMVAEARWFHIVRAMTAWSICGLVLICSLNPCECECKRVLKILWMDAMVF